ncbi:MAG: DUF4097 domain-containing protein, partial [Clostridiales bacterium]|nr:DUF4097 domain-containing protein [Clostridiales bacterium]
MTEMKNSVKIWIITAVVLIAAGAVMFTASIASANFDFSVLDNSEYVTNVHYQKERVESFDIKVTTADVSFLPSDDGTCKVVCFENSKKAHKVSLVDGTLKIEPQDTRKWYEKIGVTIGKKTEVKIYLNEYSFDKVSAESDTGKINMPADFDFSAADLETDTGDISWNANVKGEISAKADTGDITFSGISADGVTVRTSTGHVKLDGVKAENGISVKTSTGRIESIFVECRELKTECSTGKVFIKSSTASELMDIRTTTGGVTFESADAGEIKVKTDTGSVKGSLRTMKYFNAKTDTGKIELP